jgi:hypothetical protein
LYEIPKVKNVTLYILPEVDALITSRSEQLGVSRSKYIESLILREFSKPEGSADSKPEIPEV